ncbi:hypothetical protein EMMF5_003519 [Cystobasidiomycetes sp. EMM_F5]
MHMKQKSHPVDLVTFIQAVKVTILPTPDKRLETNTIMDDDEDCAKAITSGKSNATARTLPWEIIVIILDSIYGEWAAVQSGRSSAIVKANDVNVRKLQLRAHYRCLLRLSLVSSSFCNHFRNKLFTRFDHAEIPFLKQDAGTSALLQCSGHFSIGSYVRTLCLPTSTLAHQVPAMIRTCLQVHRIELDVCDVQRSECLVECIQGALSSLHNLKEVRLLRINSVRAFSIAMSLPFRLQKAEFAGFGDRMGGFWENPHDWYDVEELNLVQCRFQSWDNQFFTDLFAQHNARPPSNLRVSGGSFDLSRVSESWTNCLRTLIVEDAQKMLDLGELRHFRLLHTLAISTKHDFLKCQHNLSYLTDVVVTSCNDPMTRVLIKWLCQQRFPALRRLSFAAGAFAQQRDMPGLDLLSTLEETLRRDCQLQVLPDYPLKLAAIT